MGRNGGPEIEQDRVEMTWKAVDHFSGDPVQMGSFRTLPTFSSFFTDHSAPLLGENFSHHGSHP